MISDRISIIIAARDEAEYVGTLVRNIKDNLDGTLHEIIVVDDGSRDTTASIARASGAIVHSTVNNLGKGGAMKLGAAHSSGDIIVFIDGDGAHDPGEITRLVAPLLEDGADLVIGSRLINGNKQVTGPAMRKFSNRLASWVISCVISFIVPALGISKSRLKWTKITDCTSGLRAIKKSSWQEMTLVSEGFQIETEMIFEAAYRGITITEVPISCNWHTNGSHLSIISDGFRVARLLARKILTGMKVKVKSKIGAGKS